MKVLPRMIVAALFGVSALSVSADVPVNGSSGYVAGEDPAVTPEHGTMADIATAQEPEPEAANLFENPGFEEWSSSLFGVTCAGWSAPLGYEREQTDVKEGTSAMKVTSGPMNTNNLSQEVGGYPNPFVAGRTYELKINYKVLASMAGKDLQLACAWESSRDGELEHDADVLKSDWFTAAEWTEKRVTTTVPEGATTFKFAVTMPKGAVVLFDDFSFAEVLSAEPSLAVTPQTLQPVTCKTGETANVGEMNIVYANIGRTPMFDITGADRGMFSWDTTRVSGTQLLLDVKYSPTEAGKHSGMLIIESPDHPELNVTVPLGGTAFDAEAKPVITIAPAVIPPFKAEEGKDSTFRFTLTSENCADNITVRMEHVKGEAFTVSDSHVLKNETVSMSVTFRPVKAGEYESVMTFSTPGGEDVPVMLTGAGAESTEEQEKEYLTEFKFDMSDPKKLLTERFDGAAHNGTLKVDGWSNVVLKGERPWRGFAEVDPESEAEKPDTLNRCAKATAYQYQQEGGDEWEMWLMTPALDFANAESQMFTFRVMGDMMFEGHETGLELYYIDTVPGEEPYFDKIEMEMPSTPDLNGEWSEIHMDLEGQNLADVFFMAFRFTGVSGDGNTVTYHVDDVSFGRTDLAVIKPGAETLTLQSQPGKEVMSAPIKVTGENLTVPVTLKTGGSNPSNFKLSTNSIPTEGGEFTVRFKSDNEGVHEAYVKFSSKDAADKYLPMSALCKVQTGRDEVRMMSSAAWERDGVLYIDAATATEYALYDMNGGRVLSGVATEGVSERGVSLAEGIYLLKMSNGDVHKVIVK